MRAASLAHLILLALITLTILGDEYTQKHAGLSEQAPLKHYVQSREVLNYTVVNMSANPHRRFSSIKQIFSFCAQWQREIEF
jgi:hypothetical protein